MNNPYEYLGLSRGASEDQVKSAYKSIAASIQNSSANEIEKDVRMNELNNAYDAIMNELRGNPHTNAYTERQYNNDASQFSDVRQRINAGRIDDAETILDGIPTSMRNAEWNYLKGVIHQRRGWMNEAFRCYQNACRLEPSNQEYAAAFNALNNNAHGGYRTSRKNSSDGVCDLCTGLLCADCCCECCGGDLIPCC